jgi:DnaJ-class molecular chaperone
MQKSREIYHKPCENCKSKGYLITKPLCKCNKCDGQGWRTVKGKDLVCSACNGEGKKKHINKLECTECKGKGNLPRVVEEVSIDHHNCKACDGLGQVYYWICVDCFDSAIYDDWDGIRCKTCDKRCKKVLKLCDNCYDQKYRVLRTLKDIKTGEVFEVNEWAHQDENDEELPHDYLMANAKAWIS